MRKFIFIIVVANVLIGCTAIPTDFFPKFRFAWSQDARDYRAEKNRAEQRYESSTNEVIHPTH